MEANIWDLFLSAGASLLGGYLSGQGAQQGGEATAGAAKDATALQKQIYYDQRGLAMPAYLTGGAAANKLAAIYGIAPQDYSKAFMGGNNYGGSGAYNPADWGAGQPVAGHTGGGGSNALASLGGGALGGILTLGNPLGALAGSALGGLIRDGGDNWQTLGTSAPTGFDYDAYWNSNPDLQTATNGWNKPDNQALFGGNRDAYLWWHYNTFGKNEGRTLPTAAGGASPLPVGGAQQETPTGTTGGNALNPMQEFTASPYGQMAISGFRGVDTPEINSAFARGGKVLSGAQSIALDERGKARMGGAFNDYTNGLRAMAGMNQTASSQIGSAASAYGTNASNNMIAAGQAKGNALASAYQGMGQGIAGAAGALQSYGQKNWGW